MYVTEIDSIWAPKGMPWQLIPWEYQGFVFLIFIAIGFAMVLYGLWLMATDPELGRPEPKAVRK